MQSIKEVYDKIRGMVRRATLKNVKDTGEMQTASVEVAPGIWRDDVEILQPYGFASSAPEDGALTILLGVAGDQGDLVALPVGNPKHRMGKLPKGAAGIYTLHGDKVMVYPDGRVVIKGATSIDAQVGGTRLLMTPAGIDSYGGYFRHNDVDIGDTHKHGGVAVGTAETDVPVS